MGFKNVYGTEYQEEYYEEFQDTKGTMDLKLTGVIAALAYLHDKKTQR